METDQIYTTLERRLFLLLGVIIIACAVWVTHLYYEYRVVNNLWTETFISPSEFWSSVPDWEWRSVYG